MPMPSVSKATSSGEDSFFSLQVNFTTSACLSPYRWVFVLVLTGSYNRIFQTRKMRNYVVASRNFTVPADLLSSEDLFLNKMTPPHTHTLMRAELLWMNCFLKPLPLSNGFPIPTGGMFQDPRAMCICGWCWALCTVCFFLSTSLSTPISPSLSPLWCMCMFIWKSACALCVQVCMQVFMWKPGVDTRYP